MGTIADKLLYLNGTKSAIFNAISATGVGIPSDATFRQYVDYVQMLTYKPPVTTGSLEVGSTVYLNENNSPVPYLVVHQGLPSSLYDSSCNGTWLLRQDIVSTSAFQSFSDNTYNGSMAASAAASRIVVYDTKIQNVIKQVKIPFCLGNGSSTVYSGANGLSCKLFLLSGCEVDITNQYLPIDGAVLSYFQGAATEIAKRVANYNGSATSWWLRSADSYSSTNAWYASSNGGPATQNVKTAYGVRPALIMPQDLIVDGNNNVTAQTA